MLYFGCFFQSCRKDATTLEDAENFFIHKSGGEKKPEESENLQDLAAVAELGQDLLQRQNETEEKIELEEDEDGKKGKKVS